MNDAEATKGALEMHIQSTADKIVRQPRRPFPAPSAYHRFDEFASKTPALRWLDKFLRGAHVPSDRASFWTFWDPLDKRIAGLMHGRDRKAWLAVRGHLMRIAIDQADIKGHRDV